MLLKTLLHKKLDFFTNSEWDIDKKRKYRQTTGIIYFAIFLAVISFFLSIFYETYYATALELINVVFCFYEFKLLKNKKLKLAQTIGIYYFEIQVFITAILFSTYFSESFVWSYPLLLSAIYPAIAALFDLSILKHFLIAVVQILIFQVLYFIFPTIFFTYIVLLEQSNELLIKVVSFTYLALFNTTIIYLIYKELIIANKKVMNYSASLTLKNEKIEELNNTKDRLFSIISHDLRSPFNSIIGFSNLLLESPDLSNKQRTYSEIIQDSSKSTLNLLDNLLYWSKSQMNSIQPNFKPYKLYTIVNEVVENLNTVALQKKILLKNNINTKTTVVVDINLIEIVIRNLISNAIKFSNKNSSIEINENIASDNFLEISIKDYGIGIDSSKVETIFQQNISELGTNNEKGSGLGLLLCKEFVTTHKGKIWVESKKEKGTEVHFTVPFN